MVVFRPALSGIAILVGVLLWLAERAPDIAAGIDLARETIDSGAADDKLEALRTTARA